MWRGARSTNVYAASLVTLPSKELSLSATAAKKIKENILADTNRYFADILKLPESLLSDILGLLNYKEMFYLFYRPQYPQEYFLYFFRLTCHKEVITSIQMTTAATNMEHDIIHAFVLDHTKDIKNEIYLHDVFSKRDIFSLTKRDKYEVLHTLYTFIKMIYA